MPAKKKSKNPRKQKLESLPRKRRRLMRLWTECVHDLHGGKCAICGKEHGAVDPSTGKPSYMNAHHIEPRATCAALRYDPMNGILLCPSCHKFGRNSAHKGSIWFITWLYENRRGQYDYVMLHRDDTVNINDRTYLNSVESSLRAQMSEKEVKSEKELAYDSECQQEQVK